MNTKIELENLSSIDMLDRDDRRLPPPWRKLIMEQVKQMCENENLNA